MSNRKTPLLAGTALALAAGCALPAAAQIRIEASPASLINPQTASDTRALFERSGLFTIAGGVLPAGHAMFLLDEGGGTPQPVSAAGIQPIALPDGTAALRDGARTYHVAMPPGLACPLGEFVARDGVVAYTVPKYADPDARLQMLRAGILHQRIAREFDGTPFAALVKAADFGATVPLPPALSADIATGINSANGIGGLVLTASDDVNNLVGSYINSGIQVTYRVYLMPQTASVEIGGVPLRYFWKLENTGDAGVFSVEMFAQNWGANAHLTDLTAPKAQPTQYDVVNFYQVAALFRQLHETNGAAFAAFVDRACNKTI